MLSTLNDYLKRFDNTDATDTVNYTGNYSRDPYTGEVSGLLGNNTDSVDYVGFYNPIQQFQNKLSPATSRTYLPSLQNRLFADPVGTGGPTTRTVQGQGIFTDLNSNQLWNQGENYNPADSIWNNWMSAQDAMQDPTTPTTEGLGYVPTTQAQQDYQNALTMADYTDTPLTAEQSSQYASAANPKKTWKTEMASGNDWLGDLF